jgi:hypothetical protein
MGHHPTYQRSVNSSTGEHIGELTPLQAYYRTKDSVHLPHTDHLPPCFWYSIRRCGCVLGRQTNLPLLFLVFFIDTEKEDSEGL